jgi:putative tRNA adenosine deaminase-associated protein
VPPQRIPFSAEDIALGENVSTFAAAVAKGEKGWTASELELTGLADIDEVVDRLQDVDPDAEVTLLLVEADDQYLVILRLDEGEDLRIFGSDSAYGDESRLGALLLGDIETPALEIDELAAPPDDDDSSSTDPDADPVGDAELLNDLGISSGRLLALCAQEGLMPSDVTAEIGRRVGFADELDELRDA